MPNCCVQYFQRFTRTIAMLLPISHGRWWTIMNGNADIRSNLVCIRWISRIQNGRVNLKLQRSSTLGSLKGTSSLENSHMKRTPGELCSLMWFSVLLDWFHRRYSKIPVLCNFLLIWYLSVARYSWAIFPERSIFAILDAVGCMVNNTCRKELPLWPSTPAILYYECTWKSVNWRVRVRVCETWDCHVLRIMIYLSERKNFSSRCQNCLWLYCITYFIWKECFVCSSGSLWYCISLLLEFCEKFGYPQQKILWYLCLRFLAVDTKIVCDCTVHENL